MTINMTDFDCDAALVLGLKFVPLQWDAEPEHGEFTATGESGCDYRIALDEDGEFSLSGCGLRSIPSFTTIVEAKMRANRIEAQRQNGIVDFVEAGSAQSETELNCFITGES